MAYGHSSASGSGSVSQGSEELQSKLKDKELLKTLGFVGGEWTPASDGSTYDVSTSAAATLITSRSCPAWGSCDISSYVFPNIK